MPLKDINKRRLYNRTFIRNFRYGMPAGGYESLLAEQGGHCALCGRISPLVVDHNHVSGEVRGLLCRKCNTGLGQFNDSGDLLRAALAYLQKK